MKIFTYRLMCAAVTPSSSSLILSVTHRTRSSPPHVTTSSSSSPGCSRPNALLQLDIKTKQIEVRLHHHLSNHNFLDWILKNLTYLTLFQTCYNLPAGCSVNSCDINHNGSLVVCGCSDGCLRIIDLRWDE